MSRQPTQTPMPDDFYWAPRCHLDSLPTGLFLHGELVAMMLERLDGSWFASLRLQTGLDAPLVNRSCSSFDAGRRGCEMWALRHEAALRARVAVKLQWIQDNVVLHPPGGRRVNLERLDERAARAAAQARRR